jgi:hypothetical protein
MSLGLHQQCQNRLVESLADQLRGVRINNGVFLDLESMIGILTSEKILPQTGKQKDALDKSISDAPLFDFVFETISRDIYENGKYNSESESTTLCSLHRYADPNAIARRLVDEFNSLPWRYVVSFELNSALGKMLRAHALGCVISDRMRLVAPDASYGLAFPMASGVEERDKSLFGGYGLLSIRQKHEWNQETSYLQFDADGFIGRYSKTTPIEDVISSLKAFFGLCLAVDFLRVKRDQEKSLGVLFQATVRSYLIVHRREDDQWLVWTTLELPQDISETLNNLEVNDFDGRIETSQIGGWVSNRIQLISFAFRYAPKAEKVLLAGQWLLDSYVGKNELLSFVQTTVAMEILLGEKAKSDIIGIGELLRNRCAYLIGKSHNQREEILKDFERIYDVRSKIVHRGKSRLTSDERSLFRKLQWICQRVITEEIKLIIADEKKST